MLKLFTNKADYTLNIKSYIRYKEGCSNSVLTGKRPRSGDDLWSPERESSGKKHSGIMECSDTHFRVVYSF